jgi:hypothetical protein
MEEVGQDEADCRRMASLFALAQGALPDLRLTGPAITKKMGWMKNIDRRVSVAPMMDWTDDR